MNVSISVDTSKYDQMVQTVRKAIEDFPVRYIIEATPLVQQTMANYVPVKTGRLRASIYSEINNAESITSTNTGYGKFVDQPTAPHIIRPNIAKLLRFTIDGKTVYAQEVSHPGTPGSFFISRIIDAIRDELVGIAKNVWGTLTR